MSEGEEAYIERDFWAVREAAWPLLPSGLSSSDYQSLIGDSIRRTRSSLIHADFAGLLLPGLAALGVTAQLLPLPLEETDLLPYLESQFRSVPLPVFAFAGDPTNADILQDSENASPSARSLAQQDQECRILRQGIITDFSEAEPPSLCWRNAGRETCVSTPAEFCALFTHALTLRKTSVATRRVRVNRALQTWLVFAAAYPDRVVTGEAEDDLPRAQAAAFLEKAAGRQRDRISNRLRLAGARFADADIAEALSLLREAVLPTMNLPAPIYNALMTPPGISLHDTERRELIYLARAGTRDMKVLSAQRLASECAHPDARRTLEQLAYDPDPWVRAAVCDEVRG